MFIIDFDDTLFDTQAFKQARLEAMKDLGVSDELYWQTYKQAVRNHEGIFTYSNKRHAEVLAMHGFSEELVFRAFEEIEISQFIFPDTINFLEEIKSLGQPLVLLSLGDSEFQYLKVKACGIEKYFDRVFMVDDTKEHTLRELFNLVSQDDVWFINDKVLETKDLVKIFPQLKVVLRMSPSIREEEYEMGGLPYFKTLTEIKNYVREKI